MADDRDARIAQLEAQVRQFQNLYAATLTEVDVLRTELRQRDDRPVEDTADGLIREAYDRLYGTAMEEARPEAPLDYEQLVVELERRTRELTEARGQQTATAEILRAIAAAPTDVQPVLDAICESARRLSHSPEAAMGLRDDDFLRLVAGSGEGSSSVAYIGLTWPLTRRTNDIFCVTEARTIYVPDGSDPAEAILCPDGDSRLPQATLNVPMMHEGRAIGMLRVARPKVRGYSTREIALVESFADQAAIAVANAGLFQELEHRNAELQASHRRVTEALEQQTATAEVLRVIASSQTDLEAALNAILRSAIRLTVADDASIRELRDNLLVCVAATNARLVGEQEEINRGSITRSTMDGASTVHVYGTTDEVRARFPDSDFHAHGYAVLLATPLLRASRPIGVWWWRGARRSRSRTPRFASWRRLRTRRSSPSRTRACSRSWSGATRS